MPTVSVLIPCYRHAHFLGEAIESVLAQTYRDFEIIVIDNASPDNPGEVAARYPAVRCIRLEKNLGICGASNAGIQYARGRYIVILHADDRLLPTHLETNLEAFREKPHAAFVAGDHYGFGVYGPPVYPKRRPDLPNEYYAALLHMNFIGPPVVVMFRRDILLAVGGFDPAYEGADDHELYLRIARQYEIHWHGRMVAEYRRHEGQASSRAGLTFRAAMAVQRAQRKHVRGNPRYQHAYRLGLWHRRRFFGDLTFWQVVSKFRRGDYSGGLRDLRILLLLDPMTVMRRVVEKAGRMVGRGAADLR